jgi:hypothetical protein
MRQHTVTLAVTPFAKVQCKFWLADEVWTGSAEELGITVHGATFEQAKSDLELELGRVVETLLYRQKQIKAQRLA